MHYFHSAIKKK